MKILYKRLFYDKISVSVLLVMIQKNGVRKTNEKIDKRENNRLVCRYG